MRPRYWLKEMSTARWVRTIERSRRDAIWRREQFYGVLLAFMGPIVRVVGAVDRKLRWAEVRDQDHRRPRPAWRVWLTPRVSAVSSALQRFTAKRVF